MSETRQMATLMAITLAIGVIALALALLLPGALEGNLAIDRYDAAISPDGTLTERYTYVVKEPAPTGCSTVPGRCPSRIPPPRGPRSRSSG